MRKRPLLLFVSSLLFLYFPIQFTANYLQKGLFTSGDFVLSFILPIVLLFFLIRVTKVGWYTLVATVSLLGLRDLQSYHDMNSSSIELFTHILIYVFSLTYFINPRVRHLYFDPKSRWWRTKRRFETHLPFLMNHKSVWHYPILRNISEGGCFVETSHLFDVGGALVITIPLPIPLGVSVIKAEGEVRWISDHPGNTGVGIQFKMTPPEHLKALKEYVRRGL